MNFVFENRWYSKHEILKQFSIAEKTWKNWLYDEKGKKKKDLASMGIYKNATYSSKRRMILDISSTRSALFFASDPSE